MPEGPEIFYLSQMLNKLVKNKRLNKITSNTKTTRKLPNSSEVVEVKSKGKIMWIKTKSYYVHLHMGISGWLVTEKPKIYKYILHFSGKDVYLKDQRRFSRIDIFNEKQHNEQLEKLGTDVLTKDFSFEKFQEALNNCRRNISAVLMDQSVFSGIGNYIRNDALYTAKIAPDKKVCKIDKSKKKKLYESIRKIVFSNVYEWLKIDNLKIPEKIKNIAPNNLDVPYNFKIYGREKVNGEKVKISTVAGRKTYTVNSQLK